MDDMETQPVTVGTDRLLADKIVCEGDERAFRELYRRHTPRLLQLVMRFLGRPETEAEDVVQETWIRASDGLERFQWNSTFSTWLTGIGLNVARDHLRRSARSKTVAVEEPPDIPGPTVAHDDRIDLERAIQFLPDGYRMVLVLHDVEGMKHREIGETLGISPGTSKSQLSGARKMLRTMLAGKKENDNE